MSDGKPSAKRKRSESTQASGQSVCAKLNAQLETLHRLKSAASPPDVGKKRDKDKKGKKKERKRKERERNSHSCLSLIMGILQKKELESTVALCGLLFVELKVCLNPLVFFFLMSISPQKAANSSRIREDAAGSRGDLAGFSPLFLSYN